VTKIKDRSDGAMMPLPARDDTVPNPHAKDQSANGYPALWPN
jgi:hypothetical protein